MIPNRQGHRRPRTDQRVLSSSGAAVLHPLVLVYSGWELVYRAELTDGGSAAGPPPG